MVDTTPIFFCKETHPKWGWLSQWYPIEFEHEGITYVTAEMWMMIQKAKLFDDQVSARIRNGSVRLPHDLHSQDSVQKMLETKNPQEHQDLGRKVANYDGKLWNQCQCLKTVPKRDITG